VKGGGVVHGNGNVIVEASAAHSYPVEPPPGPLWTWRPSFAFVRLIEYGVSTQTFPGPLPVQTVV
jgi:hypothetical protein